MKAGKQCTRIKSNGERCKVTAEPSTDLCWHHAPEHAAQRAITAAKGGRAKAGELSDVKARLRQLADDVLSSEVDRASGSVAAQILGVYLRAVEAERKVRETEELAAEVAELRQAINNGRGGWAS